jgi:hypothetical protein
MADLWGCGIDTKASRACVLSSARPGPPSCWSNLARRAAANLRYFFMALFPLPPLLRATSVPCAGGAAVSGDSGGWSGGRGL